MSQASALALTVAVEAAVGLALAGRRGALLAATASLITHPFAFAANGALPGPFALRAALIELSVTGLEALGWWRLLPTTAGRAVAWAAATNGASFAVGLLLWWTGR